MVLWLSLLLRRNLWRVNTCTWRPFRVRLRNQSYARYDYRKAIAKLKYRSPNAHKLNLSQTTGAAFQRELNLKINLSNGDVTVISNYASGNFMGQGGDKDSSARLRKKARSRILSPMILPMLQRYAVTEDCARHHRFQI